MQEKTKKTSPLSESTEDLPSTQQNMQRSRDSSSWIVYRHISEIPLYLVIDALVDGKIHGIVVSGHPPEKEVEAAWADLVVQYNEGLGDSESRLFFSLHKQILQKEITLQQVELAITMLRGSHAPELLEFLNGVFFTQVRIDETDAEDRERKLNVFKNQKASIRMAIDMKRIQYDAIKRKKQSAGNRPDRAYFQTMLLNLSDFAKYEVTDRISTFQYVERVRRLDKFLQKVK